MKFAAAVLLLAGLARAQPAPADPDLKKADALAEQASAAAADIRTMLTRRQCPPGESIKDLVQDFADKKFPAGTADTLPDRAKADVRLYYSCRALAAGDSTDCRDLAFLNGVYTYDLAGNRSGEIDPEVLDAAKTEEIKEDSTHEARCVARFKRERMVRALIDRDPKAAAYCRIYVDDRKEFRADAADRACGLIAEQPRDRDALCRTLSPLFTRPATMPFCLQLMSELYADASACSHVTGGFFPTHTCEQLGQYREARERKDPALCAGGMCRMWLGAGASACEFYGATFRSAVCGSLVAPAVAEEKAKDLAGLVAQAEAALNDAEGRIESHSGGRVADAIDARAEKLARLLTESDAELKSVKTPDAPGAPASAK